MADFTAGARKIQDEPRTSWCAEKQVSIQKLKTQEPATNIGHSEQKKVKGIACIWIQQEFMYPYW